jgi:putative heme-binding domain-containing protein
LAELARFDQSNLGERLMIAWQKLPPSLKDRVVDVLSQRPQWATAFVSAVEAGKVPATAAGVNQIRKLQSVGTPELQKRVKAVWGIVRDGRNPARENVAREMAVHLGKTRGDAVKGQAVFAKNCAVCHKFHGVGQEVGPEITSNGRASFEQLLSNVFDPSLVIGSAFQATTVLTTKGRLVSGLIVEDSPNRVTLKVQGGTLEVIPRGEVEQVSVSANSLMPEGLEKQITPSEIADLFAFLVLEKPPGTDPTLKKIPGAP